jgi:hypothetical protein
MTDRMDVVIAIFERMDKTIRKHTTLADLDEIKADEYRYWQDRPLHERMAAVSEITQEQYAIKGAGQGVPRLQRTLVRFERPQR